MKWRKSSVRNEKTIRERRDWLRELKKTLEAEKQDAETREDIECLKSVIAELDWVLGEID